MNRAMWIFGLVAAALAVGCGSDGGNDLSCGGGTVASDGQCVPVGNDGGVDGSGGAAGEAGAAGSSPAAPCEKSGHCFDTPMVMIEDWPDGIDGEPFEIDAHEVTKAEYAVFLQDVADGFVPQQTDALCSWNTDHEPDPQCYYEQITHLNTDELYKPGYPIVCIDWCDAQQYCAWAGKRLCGTDATGLGTSEDPEDDTKKEWLLACSGGTNVEGTRAKEYQEGECTWDNPCEDYPGVYNLAGGVAEPVDYCFEWETGDVSCLIHGGGFGGPPSCDDRFAPEIDNVGLIGIRCCR